MIEIDHTPHTHPAAPTSFSLPETFASYRQKAQQHGPLGKGQGQNQNDQQFLNPFGNSSSSAGGAGAGAGSNDKSAILAGGLIGGRTGAELGPVRPQQPGVAFDRSEIEPRFWRSVPWSADEIEAVETGGASLVS